MNRFAQLIPYLFVSVAVVLVPVSLSACGGSTSSPTAPSAPAVSTTLPPGVTAAMVAEGQALFNTGSCFRCHGMNGRSPSFGPDLTDQVFLHNAGAYEDIVQVITTGVPASNFKLPTSQPQFAMFPRGGSNLTDAQVRAVAAYVWTLSHPS
jgi:mono/diheme cytochrome c family protein